jgi:hypothetical protein
MSGMAHIPTQGLAMNSIARKHYLHSGPLEDEASAAAALPARLQAIHDLIRSGDYRVPAAAIAERMVEQMLSGERRRPV